MIGTVRASYFALRAERRVRGPTRSHGICLGTKNAVRAYTYNVEEAIMRSILMSAALIGTLVLPVAAEAKGCIKGAIVGAVAGHVAGHGKLGAVAGCVIGHHEANKHQDARPEQRTQGNQTDQ
jgi:hypothetical protein